MQRNPTLATVHAPVRTLIVLLLITLLTLTPMVSRSLQAEEPDTPTVAQPPQSIELTDTYPFYQNEAIAKAITYIQTQQLDDGGIDSFQFGSDPTGTARVVLALNAVGYPVDNVVSAQNNTLLDFLESTLVATIYANDTPATSNLFPGRAGQTLAAVAAAGRDPTNFGGVNLVAELEAVYTAAGDGTYSTSAEEGFASGAASTINQTLAILGLVAAARPIPQAATDWLISQQNTNGSWNNSFDVTGYAIVALVGSTNVPLTSPAIQNAIAYYRSSQTSTTALWGDAGSGEPANSTGWAMTALATAGYIPPAESWGTGGTNPRAALIGLQNEEGVIAGRFFNAYATLEALFGLSTQPIFLTKALRTERVLSWMAQQQNSDGSWGSFSITGSTLDVVFAYTAAGYNPASVTTGGNSPIGYLRQTSVISNYTGIDGTLNVGATAKLILGLLAAGENPTNFGTPTSYNLAQALIGSYNDTTGTFAGVTGPINHSLALLALSALNNSNLSLPNINVTPAANALIGLQFPDGSWGNTYYPSGTGTPDATGLALQALIAAGIPNNNSDVVEAITYLRNTQDANGGYQSFGAYSTNSTAYAIQGLLAAGVNLNDSTWLKNGRSPIATLLSYQKPDGPFALNWDYASSTESFNFTADNLFATQQAAPVIVGAFYPYSNGGNLMPFMSVPLGPDPDILVVAPPYAVRDGNTVTLFAPYGSDLDGDGDITLNYQVVSGGTPTLAQTTPISTTRQPGYWTATLNASEIGLGPLDSLQLQATYTDADLVQNGTSTSTEESTTEQTLVPLNIYLPVVISN